MHKEVEKYLRVKRKLIVLEYARVFGSNLEAYKACGIPKSTFYDWKKAFEEINLRIQEPNLYAALVALEFSYYIVSCIRDIKKTCTIKSQTMRLLK